MSRTKLRGLAVAGLRISVESPPALPWDWPDGPLRRFAATPIEPDVEVGVRVARIEAPPAGALRYDSDGGIFDVAREGRDWLIALRIRGELQRLARFDAGFRQGEVIVAPDSFYAREAHYPLAYPLDELLFLHHLARRGGLLVHACGVERAGRALLFTGPSGAGKTTIARWMLRDGRYRVLSDDRVALRPLGGGFQAFGTPWHGDAPLASPGPARLEAIHQIRHAPRLRAEPLKDAEAAAAVLGNAFLPVHDPEAAVAALAAVDRLVARVPVMRLACPRDPSVIAFTWGGSRPPPGARRAVA